MKAKIVSVTMGGDLARFGFAILLASAFGAIQVFVIPSRLDIVTYGEYRLFLVYVGYVGLLHFGLADGAFLRWAGQPAGAIRQETSSVATRLAAISLGILAVAILAAAIVATPIATVYLVGLALAALAMNTATLASYALQAAGDFRGAGRVAVLSPGLFVIAIVALPLHSLRAVLSAYLASFAIAAVAGAMRLTRDADAAPPIGAPLDYREMIRRGLPVLGANIAASLSQFGDRILVSIAVPITSFALYGFASSVMVTANAATQTLSRVALSHAARQPVDGEARAVFLGGFYDLIAAGFGLAMAGVPFFEFLVAKRLPAYVSAISIVRALMLGAPFWVAIHVVLVGTLQSYGLVRRQLTVELLGLAFVVLGCGGCLVARTPLWIVAAAGSGAAVIAWSIGVALVQRWISGARAQPIRRFVPIVLAQSAAVLLALSLHWHWIEQSVLYVALALAPTFLAARAARRHGW